MNINGCSHSLGISYTCYNDTASINIYTIKQQNKLKNEKYTKIHFILNISASNGANITTNSKYFSSTTITRSFNHITFMFTNIVLNIYISVALQEQHSCYVCMPITASIHQRCHSILIKIQPHVDTY